MKPKKLILCGWGPYKDKQEINFELLGNRGLFLITGPTGAGKTTIFDAITYALYGNMSGMVREKNSVRSDFAGSDVKTYVELYMTHAEKEYHILRNPEYLRPKKRKTGACDMTKEKERAVLVLPDGSKIEGIGEVNEKIQEILRLDYRQFKQLSLIAQGEFAKLMTAASSEKSRILREIFDTEILDKAAGLLRSRTNNLYNRVKEYEHKMEEDIAFFTPMEEEADRWKELTAGESFCFEELSIFLTKLQEQQQELLAKCREESGKYRQEAEAMAGEIARAERTNALFEKQKLEKEKKEMLTQQAGSIKEKEQRVAQAGLALEVRSFEQAWQYAEERANEILQKNEGLKKEITGLKEKQKAWEEFYRKWELIELSYAYEQKEAVCEETLQELNQALSEQKEMLSDLQREYLSAEEEELSAKADYEQADQSYRHAMAGILASGLQEHMPCPVCGSLKHPQKAKLSEKMPTAEMVKSKKLFYEKKQQISLSLHGRTAACRERTEGILQSITQAEKEKALLLQKRKEQDAFVTAYTRTNTKTEYEKEKKACEALQVQLKEKEALLQEGQNRGECRKQEAERAKEAFEGKRRDSGFLTAEAYRQAFLGKEEQEKLSTQIASYREEKHANEQLLLHLEEELLGKETVQVALLQQELDRIRRCCEEREKKLLLRNRYLQDIIRLRNALLWNQEKKQELEKEYGTIKRLYDAASGNNRLRLVFEQYVLATYFEEILSAANIRLKMMSAGRYELCRLQEVGDGRRKDNLEIEVMDYYTGKYRSIKTLSGGESFKTSLSLALGMSDVVQAYSGGVRVETLFIDEGFGSLDSESLEQASRTLQSLVEGERLIGIISHVPELAEKIRNQIRIDKTNAGSRAEIVVS